jgi:hypothetical protein
MTKASKYLYTATRERSFFKEIKILLPATWSRDPRYVTATSENLAFADVIITDPIRGKRSLPQARSYDGCGKQGVHVLLSKEFLTIPRAEPYFNDPGMLPRACTKLHVYNFFFIILKLFVIYQNHIL